MGKCLRETTVPNRLPPIRLGDRVRIDQPVILAPMSGVTDLPFRRLAKQLGAGMVVSEMIASWAMIRENEKTLAMARWTAPAASAPCNSPAANPPRWRRRPASGSTAAQTLSTSILAAR